MGELATIDELAAHEAERPGWITGANSKNAPLHHYAEDVLPPVVLDAASLLSRHFRPREALLSPWLTSQSLTMVYARRGVGKTHFALGVAYALASAGEFLGWTASKATPVLYLDGEMPGADLQKRLSSVIANAPTQAEPDALRVMTPDVQPDGRLPNLYTPEGQAAINLVIGDAQVIVVDNLSCLVRGGKENESESWTPVAEWALRQRSAGRSVIFIHHAGKGGQQRGTSKREDLLDTVISLRRPADYVAEQGARFEIHFEKARALYGTDVDPMDARLETLPDGRSIWTTKRVADATDAQVIEMAELGLSTREIGAELEISHSTVVRTLNRLKEAGRYSPKPKRAREPKPHWSDQ